ncbi:WW domain binding protein VOPP1 [Lampetra fluviatilis]
MMVVVVLMPLAIAAAMLEACEAKYCNYHKDGFSRPFTCPPYEDCCGKKCCVRVISLYRIWYFWFCLLLGILFCCGSGLWLRRRYLGPRGIASQPPLTVTYTAHASGPRARRFHNTLPSGMYFYTEQGPFPGGQVPVVYPYPPQPSGVPLYEPGYPPPVYQPPQHPLACHAQPHPFGAQSLGHQTQPGELSVHHHRQQYAHVPYPTPMAPPPSYEEVVKSSAPR